MITIEIDDASIRRQLQKLAEVSGDPSPALRAIGENLVQSTNDRFVSGTAPDGSKWPANSPVTLARKAPRTKPLIGETGALMDTIRYQLQGNDTLLVGSNQEYAAAQQFGMPKGYAGKTKRGSPIPWGDIPPRPFLGLSDEDRSGILEELAAHIRKAID